MNTTTMILQAMVRILACDESGRECDVSPQGYAEVMGCVYSDANDEMTGEMTCGSITAWYAGQGSVEVLTSVKAKTTKLYSVDGNGRVGQIGSSKVTKATMESLLTREVGK